MRGKLIAAAAAAIDKADVGYNLRLTRLVDGESTYTLTYSDGTAPIEFDDISDGYAHIAERKYRAMAEAAVEAVIAGLRDGFDAGRFSEWESKDLAAQCRMQARDSLDPEYSQFMSALADRLSGAS
ncbi:MAG: hypothetical protein P0Y64_16740 [Candidatus Sphingomonas colombiensis]|nr:hypothetical protein [Sphingomonas sp.]WEK42967.1 MAG: hypothetical protein P0Y64_16740 [Sphingomonas sp.]